MKLLRQTHASQHAREPWVRVKSVEPRINVDSGEPLRAVFFHLLQPAERLVSLAQTRVENGEVIRRDVLAASLLRQLLKHFSRVRRSAGHCVHMPELGQSL